MIILMAGQGIEIEIHGSDPMTNATYGELDYNYAIAADGAWTERKGPTLTFHFRAVPEHGRTNMRMLASRAHRLKAGSAFSDQPAAVGLVGRQG